PGYRRARDSRLGRGSPPCNRVPLPRREGVVDDAAHNARVRSVAVPLDQRVEVVLRGEDIGHPAIALEETDPTYSPVASVGGELVGVERHVRPVKPAHADVEDAGDERLAVVPRDR